MLHASISAGADGDAVARFATACRPLRKLRGTAGRTLRSSAVQAHACTRMNEMRIRACALVGSGAQSEPPEELGEGGRTRELAGVIVLQCRLSCVVLRTPARLLIERLRSAIRAIAPLAATRFDQLALLLVGPLHCCQTFALGLGNHAWAFDRRLACHTS